MIMKKQTEHPLTKLAEAAFRQAAQKVIKRAEESGTPVIVWENETVTKVKPGKFRNKKVKTSSRRSA
jgi:hypothetical protein